MPTPAIPIYLPAHGQEPVKELLPFLAHATMQCQHRTVGQEPSEGKGEFPLTNLKTTTTIAHTK